MLQVSALRSAIHYIKALQSLVAECDAGTLSQEIYSTSAALDSRDTRAGARQPGQGAKQRQTRRRPRPRLQRPGPSSPSSSSSSSPPSDKWTHYSPAQLRQRFCPQEPAESQVGAVNEISLHISLLDSVPSAASTQPPAPATSNQQPVLYILQLNNV